jgi:hypothetical protein
MTIFSLSTVFFFSISPVGGLLAAVVAGIGLGLHPAVVLLVSVVASALPALFLPPLCSLAELHPRISTVTNRWRTAKAQQFFARYGVWGMATLGRFVVGPYPAVMTVALFGVKRRKILLVFVLGSALLSLFFLMLTVGGFTVIR